MSEPLIVGIRHHSPACARLVKSLIESQRPRYVLIEGPADFNDRVDELFLAHQLPVAIYSYCQYQDGAAPGRGAWTPFAEFSPEWQALQAARRIQAQTYFIDLPCWAQSEEVDDSPDTQEESQALLLRATRMDNSDTLWDHLFEDESQQTALPSALAHYFAQLRGDSPGDALNRLREAFMARWIGWAMQQNNGDVLVVCGGWHAPVLAKMWRECPQEINTPELPSLADAVTGCYLTPYSEKRLDVLAGYLSGMPAPVWQNWCWQWGLQQAGEQLLKTVLTRLRQHKLPASTADMAAAHLHAMALAQLRGHTLPLRTDWLDAIAGSLIKEALNAPLPWSYRGVIHPDTDPILLTLIDTLAGDGFGKLAPSTPQPPLPKDVTCELERTAISLPAELTLNRFNPNGLAQSQVLHRLAILEIPGIVRQQGSTLTLAGNGEERWKLTRPLSQHAALIEAACFGATLQEAARHKLEADMLDAGGIGSITTCLSQAALAGLASFSQQLLEQLTLLIAQENQFAEMGQALEVLYALWRLDEISGMQGAQILQTTLCAAIDRTLWLCESNGRPDEKEFHAHLHSWQALCHILRDLHSGVQLPGISLSAAVALLERRSRAIHAPALDRGAAHGALMRLEHPNASAEAALTMLAQLSPAQSGEALHGLLALARHQLACQPTFIAGFSSHLNQLSDADFINALPDLRAAMAWLPPRERGTLAHQVLEHYQLAQLPVSALQMPLHCPPQAIAHHQQLEQQALASLQNWEFSMSELNDLLTTRELQRWRLILGEAAETTLCGLDDNARQIDHALEWLYGRDPERLQRGERSGGLGGSNLTTPEWINSIHTLFPQQVIERLESDAVLRYGIEDVVTNLDVLERMQPSESLLRAVLHTKHLMNPEVLAAARQIVRQVVEEIMARLAKEVRQAFSGVRDRRRRSLIPLARNFDFKSTLRANLQHWHPQHGKLYIESPALTAALNAKANNGNWSYWLIKADRWWTR